MPFLAVAVCAAVVAAVITGGNLARVAERGWRRPALVFTALVIQLAIAVTPAPRSSNLALGVLALSYVLLLMFAGANVRQRGMAVVAAGIALNALVIIVDRGMPVHAPARSRVEVTVKHHPMTDRDKLTVLADAITVRPFHQAVSLGDLVMAAGLVIVAVHASRPRRRLTAHDRHLMRLREDAMRRLEEVAQVTTYSSASSTRGS